MLASLLMRILLNIFLLGAGFNCDAMHEAGPIYGNSIYVGRSQIDCGYPFLSDALKLCFDLDKAPNDKSVEDLFSDAIRKDDFKPLERLLDRLMEADYRLAQKLAFSSTSNCYRQFFEKFTHAHFLTFNYGSLPEIFLFQLKRWFPHDGYGLPVEAVLGPLKPRGFAVLDSTSLVLHLHGSFCVYTSEFEIKRDPGEPVAWLHALVPPRYAFDPNSITSMFPPYRRAMSNTGYIPVKERVIAPIPDKAEQLHLPFIMGSYSKACSLVRESGSLIAIGYSFNRRDSASYGRVLQSLEGSAERRLTLISPTAGELALRIRHEYPNLRITPIEKTLRRWATDSFRY